MTTAEVEADPRCGATRETGRTEWVCILPPHDKPYDYRADSIYRKYPPLPGHHLFVARYPYREDR
jgi:hypothetical protein